MNGRVSLRAAQRLGVQVLVVAASLLIACRATPPPTDSSLTTAVLQVGQDAHTTILAQPGTMPDGLETILGVQSADPGSLLHPPVPVPSGARLVGSARLERADGARTFYLVYTTPTVQEHVETRLLESLGQAPWLLSGGQSEGSVATLRFRSQALGAVTGTVTLHPTNAGAPSTNLVYILQVAPAVPAPKPQFAAPTARPLPNSFPRALVLDGSTPTSVHWEQASTNSSYTVNFLAEGEPAAVSGRYRAALQTSSWVLLRGPSDGAELRLSAEDPQGIFRAAIVTSPAPAAPGQSLSIVTLQTAR